jgi:hypothetical protein
VWKWRSHIMLMNLWLRGKVLPQLWLKRLLLQPYCIPRQLLEHKQVTLKIDATFFLWLLYDWKAIKWKSKKLSHLHAVTFLTIHIWWTLSLEPEPHFVTTSAPTLPHCLKNTILYNVEVLYFYIFWVWSSDKVWRKC